MCQGNRDSGRSVEFNSMTSASPVKKNYSPSIPSSTTIRNGRIRIKKSIENGSMTKRLRVTELATANLAKYKLDDYVSLYKGELFSELDHTRYDLIFCDAMHDAHEIKHNLPLLLGVSQSICTLAFHDMTPAAIETVLALAPVKFITRADSLGVFQLGSER